ncbi:MAG: tRNA (adenosine(37)-N6)-threonylcarbamoyltransferase complex dimerization subunit type 1 TsaB [gamma proteobacterium symbiont of Bathyaustriella thionipta]|nr:tRNA (adenosine(37)-N6)-threonylcarbamoyltransferase complex dimerization subunit type 1 TsaB [gamma proteobacterium symbiont of Bathyaustriella thionipta]
MKMLAIDSSADATSAALLLDDEITEKFILEPRQASQRILGMMDELLTQAGISLQQLDALAFARGPGSFTGVRIATGVIQGTAFGADLPALAISSLRTLAQACWHRYQAENVVVAVDARMHEIYTACYEEHNGLMQLTGSEQVMAAADLKISQDRSWLGCGSGWQAYSEVLQPQNFPHIRIKAQPVHCHASDMLMLAQADFLAGKVLSAEQALPRYLRNNVAKKSVVIN